MKIQKFKLSNGFTILLWPERHQKLTSVMTVVRAGSMMEKRNKMGTAHFLEHMYFKGSKNFPNAKDLHHNLEKYGASVNAFTSYEYTSFYAVLPGRSLNFILEVFADILQNPLFPESEIEKERLVILEELRMYEDDPKRKVLDLIYETLFGNQPAGWPIGGTEKTVSQIKRADLFDFYKTCYSSLNSALIITGDFQNNQKLLQNLQTLFSAFPKRKTKSQHQTNFFHKPKIKILPKENIKQAHLVLAFAESRKPNFQERIAYRHLQTILGQGLSSRLFHILREELACAYYVSAYHDIYPDRHIFTINAGVELSKVSLALEKIVSLLRELKENGVQEEEIFKSKNILEASFYGSLETSYALADYLASSFVLQEPIREINHILHSIRNTKTQTIQKISQKIFQPNFSGLALIYPENKKSLQKDFLQIISRL